MLDQRYVRALVHGRLNEVIEHLDAGAPVDLPSSEFHGYSPLGYAVANSHVDVATLLLDRGANIDFRDTRGMTALNHAAAMWGSDIKRSGSADLRSLETMTLLLDRGARTDIGCNLGQTPLMYAAKTSHDTAIRVLLDRGADVDAVDDGGRTALMLVANGDDPRIARTICEFMRQRDPVGWRSSLEVRDRQGFTALIHAASEGSASMLIELIDQGARLDAEDTHGWRAIHHAMTRGCAFRNFEAMGILLNRGESPYGQFPDGQTYDSVIDVPEGRSVLMAAKVARVVDEVISKAIDHGDGTSFEDTSGILAEVTQRPWRPKRSLP